MKNLTVNHKQNRTLISFCLLMIVFLILGGVMSVNAYLTDGDSAKNKLVVGGVNVEVLEDFIPPSIMTPGVSFQKNITIKNAGPSSAYVRVKSVFTDGDMENHCTVDYNTADWTYNESDGYWYFTGGNIGGVLDVDEVTSSLFTTVTLDSDMDPAAIKDFDILLYAEGYQSNGFNSYEEAWTHYERNMKDYLGPSLTVAGIGGLSPDNPIKSESENYTLTGTVSDMSGVNSLIIDGDNVVINEKGIWSKDIVLTSGTTKEIKFVAEDNKGNISKFSYYVLNESQKIAYAVYSADDTSLTFYKTSAAITEGELYNGKEVTAVYTGFEEDVYTSRNDVPWYNDYYNTITTVKFENQISPVSTAFWFSGLKTCTTIDLSGLDTSNTTDMNCMFWYCSKLTSIDVSTLNTSSVYDMSEVFNECYALETITGLENWDTSKVTDMEGMFSNAGGGNKNAKIIGISNWDVSNVENMYMLFAGSLISELDLSGWNTASATIMDSMFNSCSNITVIYVGDGWNTSRASTSGMFVGCGVKSVTVKS